MRCTISSARGLIAPGNGFSFQISSPPLSDTTKAVNLDWRNLDQTVRRKSAKLSVNRLSPGR